MSSQSRELQSGLEALKQNRYSEAVNLLEMFCELVEQGNSQFEKEYLQAQMALVKAYHRNGQQEKAIALCQQLTASENPQVQAWAQQALKSLPVESFLPSQTPQRAVQAILDKQPLTPQQADELLKTGSKALKLGRYAEAVQALEKFCHGTDSSTKNYSQAQMWLIKAYKGSEQLEEAIALCRQLIISEKQIVQAWAQQFLLILSPGEALQAASSQPEAATQVSTSSIEEQTGASPKAGTVEGIKMKTLDELKNFYRKSLLTDLTIIEATRQEILKSIVVVGVILFFVLGLLITFIPVKYLDFKSLQAAKSSFLILFLFVFAFIVCMWFWVAFYSSSTETYATGFKTTIIQRIIEFIDSNKLLNYSHYAETHTTMSAFRHSQLFQSFIAPSKLSQDHCVSGIIGETDIFFSEICAEIEVSHRWMKYLDFTNQEYHINSFMMLPIYIISLIIKIFKGTPYIAKRILKGQRIDYHHFEEEVLKNEVSRKTVFKGLFYRANFNKKFKGKTVVLPDALSKIRPFNTGQGQLIKLEDPEFANLFIVYGSDQIEARYILSTNLMEKLVKFRKKAGRKLYVSFVENKIYVAIEYEKDLFEPKLFQSMLNFSPIREYFENLQLTISIVQDLNLNRRIWSRN